MGEEIFNGVGGSIDIVLKRPDGFWFYEIKTAKTARACIREALGQLLEYSYWPKTQKAKRLWLHTRDMVDRHDPHPPLGVRIDRAKKLGEYVAALRAEKGSEANLLEHFDMSIGAFSLLPTEAKARGGGYTGPS